MNQKNLSKTIKLLALKGYKELPFPDDIAKLLQNFRNVDREIHNYVDEYVDEITEQIFLVTNRRRLFRFLTTPIWCLSATVYSNSTGCFSFQGLIWTS